MKTFGMGLLALMLMLAHRADATIRYLSAQGAGQYTTFDAVASASVTGDTILVGPGTYTAGSGVNQFNKRLVWIGAGWDQTIVDLNGTTWYFNGSGANRTSVEGFRLSAPSNNAFTCTNNCDSSTVRRCYVIANYSCMAWGNGLTGRGLTIEDCLLYVNINSGVDIVRVTDANYPTVIRNCVFYLQQGNSNCYGIGGGAASGTVEVYNCVFLNMKQWLNLNTAGGPVVAVNNILWDWGSSPSIGTYNAGSVFDYNAGPASPALPGTNLITLTTDPFVNYDEAANVGPALSDLHLDLTNGAALINSGHPSLLDFTDGSQSDRGVYGGPKPLVENGVPNYPWAVNVSASPNLVGVGTPINANATVRVGPAY